MLRLIRTCWHVLAIIGLATVAILVWFAGTGVSARPEPSRMEASAARVARQMLMPADARARRNPEAASPEAIRQGMEHWADHCATCHANNGSGDTSIGRGLYPRAPDMRLLATQQLSDGELFFIIEHGVKLTGMPAWGDGTPEGERASWHLVHFIRRLPSLSEEELIEMEAFNPRSEAEWRALEEERRFLSGESPLSGELRVGPTHNEHAHKKGGKE
jgi:mono/diheme cytochrome c family protein